MTRFPALTGALLVGWVCLAAGATIRVDGSGGADYATIDEGIEAASDGDTVLVAPGVYSGHRNRNLSFEGKNLAVLSEGGAGAAVIDCEGLANNRAFVFQSGEDSTSVVSGFVIRDGAFALGGGMSIVGGASPAIDDCDFEGCAADRGGAVYVEVSAPSFRRCGFSGCTATQRGGGIYCLESSPTIVGCTFSDCDAPEGTGGAICCHVSSAPLISNCTFAGCDAVWGGALSCLSSSPHVEGSAFLRCTVTWYGSAVYCQQSSPSIVYCTLVGNGAPFDAGVFCLSGASPAITNSIIAFGTEGAPVFAIDGDPWTTRSVLFANAGGDSLAGSHADNLFTDPLLCDVTHDDVRLCSNSPCLPQSPQNPWDQAVGARGQGCGNCVAPVEASTWGRIKFLFR